VLGCHGPLYRYARSLCGEPGEAEELLHETYKRALAAKRKPEVVDADAIRPWMFTIMRNAWLNECRRRSRERSFDEAAVVSKKSSSNESRSNESSEFAMNRKLLVSEVRAAVDSLPAMWREIVVMRDVEELSYAEIAGILACPVGTVMSRLARAREALRQLLTPGVPEVRR
jgi:RNA polymerase sigma-70 factor (ECF subfamily)